MRPPIGQEAPPPLGGRGSTRVSAIVSNFNGAKYLPRLLETLQAQRGVEVDIVVVDRHSTDDSPDILAAHPDVRVVREGPESGLVAGYSVGAEHARHDLLFFCNEDMWFDPDCLARLASRVDLGDRVAAADPWQWTYDGETLIHAGTRLRTCLLDLNSPYPARRYDFTCPLEDGAVVPFGCAGAILIHRKVYEGLGGWDRSFFLDHEDVDLFLRAWQAGWKCATVPAARVYHAVNASNKKVILASGQLVGRRRFISGQSSLMILGVKYFSWRHAMMPPALWAASLARHAATLNVTKVWWYLLAARETARRIGPALAFRRANRAALLVRPGEAFFRDPDFQA